jgi:hypothetical protein
MSKADELQQRTAAFADLSIEFVTGLPETQVVRRISLQFLDASTWVGANYRADRRAKSHADFVSFGNDAMITMCDETINHPLIVHPVIDDLIAASTAGGTIAVTSPSSRSVTTSR